MIPFKKILLVLQRHAIGLLDGIDNRRFTTLYWKHLAKAGITFTGRPNYIASNAYIDGQGYGLITIGEDVVISREAMLLTHDYAIETALHSIGRGTSDRSTKVDAGITIGRNSFIGARASLLPGTVIGENCIIGSCAVVKGTVPDGAIVVGNPARQISETERLAERYIAQRPGQF
ncbi:DapH/DapD/GlmU-related protein [Schaalia hyovaginalis]|uniref:acyltransferase n=1 Tax=Schaalia hyovaginalis TaxID=29316 RepID=UPI0026F191E4|nr:acyltransferase [Schaalia hyovaginalis]MCI6556926.1 acyltransferase [Schaalia hyovaginalis]MDD7554910.1 acyltransferase [Schaalia hyovaginalis]MDY3093277.1 acyltransferase [Schaalia hyovaginalis]